MQGSNTTALQSNIICGRGTIARQWDASCIGELLDEEEKAEELIEFYLNQVSIVYDRLKENELEKPTVYVEVGKYGPNDYFNTFGDYMWGD